MDCHIGRSRQSGPKRWSLIQKGDRSFHETLLEPQYTGIYFFLQYSNNHYWNYLRNYSTITVTALIVWRMNNVIQPHIGIESNNCTKYFAQSTLRNVRCAKYFTQSTLRKVLYAKYFTQSTLRKVLRAKYATANRS